MLIQFALQQRLDSLFLEGSVYELRARVCTPSTTAAHAALRAWSLGGSRGKLLSRFLRSKGRSV